MIVFLDTEFSGLHQGTTMRHERMSAEFEKFHLSGLPFDAVLHHFTGPDRGDFHDHPWPFTTFILSGGYTERIAWQDPCDVWRQRSVRREAGTGHPVAAGLIHRVTDLPTGECWTLVLPGRWERVPGFYKFDEAGAWHRLHNEPDFTLLTC